MGLFAGTCEHDGAAPIMIRFLLRRAALTIPTFLALMFLTFVMIRLVPGDPIEVRKGERGISPEDHMTPALAAALKADGIDIASEPVLALTAADLKAAEFIAVFNQLPTALGTWRARDWSDLPSMNENYPAARAVLIPRLEALLDEIA